MQEPTAFFYPGLPTVQFFDSAQFGWASAIESATPAIRAEIEALRAAGTDDFRAYIQHETVASEANKELLGKKDWSILPLCENGWLMPTVIEKCPKTWETMLQAPLPRVAGWGPTVVFSLLKGGRAYRRPYRHVQHPAGLPPAADRPPVAAASASATRFANGKRASC